MTSLADSASSIAMETAFWYQALDDDTYPFQQLGSLTLTLERKLRALACIAALTQHDKAQFKHNLGTAAYMRITYLTRAHNEQQFYDHHFVAGRHAFMVDAIASEHWDIAAHIGQHSPQTFAKGREYEDDFCFARLLGEFVRPMVQTEPVESLLSMFEAHLTDNDPRYHVLSAIHKRDILALSEAMHELVQLHHDKGIAALTNGTLLNATELALQRISIEGIALLKIAKRQGCLLNETFAFCPKFLL